MNLFYGNSIKIYRRKHRLNQEELAQQLRISKSMLGMLENNNRNASEEIEKRITDILHDSEAKTNERAAKRAEETASEPSGTKSAAIKKDSLSIGAEDFDLDEE